MLCFGWPVYLTLPLLCFGWLVYLTTLPRFGWPVYLSTTLPCFGWPVYLTTPLLHFWWPVYLSTPLLCFGWPVYLSTTLPCFGWPVYISRLAELTYLSNGHGAAVACQFHQLIDAEGVSGEQFLVDLLGLLLSEIPPPPGVTLFTMNSRPVLPLEISPKLTNGNYNYCFCVVVW